VDIEWQDGKVTSYHITSSEAREVKINVNGALQTITTKLAGKTK
jgi:uncharacterized protein YabE (DUF348 family)